MKTERAKTDESIVVNITLIDMHWGAMTFDLTFHLWAIKKSSSAGRTTILPDLVLAGLPSFAALSSSVFSASTSDCSSTSTVGLTRELAVLEMFADRCAPRLRCCSCASLADYCYSTWECCYSTSRNPSTPQNSLVYHSQECGPFRQKKVLDSGGRADNSIGLFVHYWPL